MLTVGARGFRAPSVWCVCERERDLQTIIDVSFLLYSEEFDVLAVEVWGFVPSTAWEL